MTHESLLVSGCALVAAEGYAAASIARIADMAGVAHGTFYNYFEDRQSLFDELLPYQGLRMRERIEEEARKVPSGMQREFRRFEAFLDYVALNDGFYRVLYESEIFAPQAHKAHMANIVEGYKRTFGRAMAENRMPQLGNLQIECLIYQILGIRAYAAMQIHEAADMSEKMSIKACAVDMYKLLMGKGLSVADQPAAIAR